MRKCGLICVLLLVCSIGFMACNKRENKNEPQVITIGALPDQAKAELILRYKPLMRYLEKTVEIPFKLIVPENYSDLLKYFEAGKIDLAYFGGYTFLKAKELHGAKPLVMRKEDLEFTSSFIARPVPAKKLSDIAGFKGMRLSFGSRLSTSGHLMPRYFLEKWGFKPEQFFSEVQYSGKHDKTAFLTRDGVVDLGVLNSLVLRNLFNSGKLKTDDVSVIMETPPYADYVWAIQPGLDKYIILGIQNAFLNLSITDDEHRNILDKLNAKYYVPAGETDFTLLKEAMLLLENVKEE